MWFGDLVTMQWWNDLWLNESFATFASFYAARGRAPASPTRGPPSPTARRPGATARTSCPARTRSWPRSATWRTCMVNFDGITYAKGASVLKQLVAWVGDDHFFEGVRAYFDRHAWGNTTLADLLGALGRDLRPGPEASGRRSGWRPPDPTPCGRSTRSTTPATLHLLRGGAGGLLRGVPDPASAPCGGRPVQHGRRRAGPHRPRRAGRHRRPHRGRRPGRQGPPGAGPAQRRRPRLRQDPPGRALDGRRSWTTSATSPSRCRAPCAGAPRGTCCATPNWPRATTSRWSCAASAGSPTSAWPSCCSGRRSPRSSSSPTRPGVRPARLCSPTPHGST